MKHSPNPVSTKVSRTWPRSFHPASQYQQALAVKVLIPHAYFFHMVSSLIFWIRLDITVMADWALNASD